jgi:hypothetical protein
MNLRGSYRALRDNSKSAMIASIEIYNKPSFQYRNETFIILFLNSWELLFKAILSKNKKSIYYKKEKSKPYKTYSLTDSLKRSKEYFPQDIPFAAVYENINILKIYRDNAVHFYNCNAFDSVIYDLVQTSIINYRDILKHFFDMELANEISINLLPLSFRPPIDPISYLKSDNISKEKKGVITQFRKEIIESIQSLEHEGIDTGRLITTYKVKLESVKKVESSDIIVGIASSDDIGENPLIIERKTDPNKTHPLIQRDIIKKFDTLQGTDFTQYVFQAIIRKYNIKENPVFCWIDTHTDRPYYSQDIFSFLKKLTAFEIEQAIEEYRIYLSEKRKSES